MKTIEDLFRRVGGSVQIAAELNLNQYSVDRWEKTGVPEKHWKMLTEFAQIPITYLHEINEGIRAKRAASSK